VNIFGTRYFVFYMKFIFILLVKMKERE